MAMSRTVWAKKQQNKAIAAVILMLVAIIDGVFASPSRNFLPFIILVGCVGTSVGLLLHVWVSYIHKLVEEGEFDIYSHQ